MIFGHHNIFSDRTRPVKWVNEFNILLYILQVFLDYNNIAHIDASSFKGLTHLQVLSLAHNNIADTKEGAFSGMMTISFVYLFRIINCHIYNFYSHKKCITLYNFWMDSDFTACVLKLMNHFHFHQMNGTKSRVSHEYRMSKCLQKKIIIKLDLPLKTTSSSEPACITLSSYRSHVLKVLGHIQ